MRIKYLLLKYANNLITHSKHEKAFTTWKLYYLVVKHDEHERILVTMGCRSLTIRDSSVVVLLEAAEAAGAGLLCSAINEAPAPLPPPADPCEARVLRTLPAPPITLHIR